MPLLDLEVVGNLAYRCNNNSPRYSVRTTMPFENFLRSQILDAHNSSFFSNMSGKSFPNSNTKVQNIRDITFV